jgi:hypothetical protein
MSSKKIRVLRGRSGTHAVCEPDQMAICRVLNGIAQGECVSPPSSANSRALANWALSKITGRWHPISANVPDIELTILEKGKFKRAGGTIVTFALPDRIKTAIAELRSEPKLQARLKQSRRKKTRLKASEA